MAHSFEKIRQLDDITKQSIVDGLNESVNPVAELLEKYLIEPAEASAVDFGKAKRARIGAKTGITRRRTTSNG
jgi:hypothetical protein